MGKMKLLTREDLKRIPPIGSQNGDDPVCQVKFFTPDSNWTWYVIEGSAMNREGEISILRLGEETGNVLNGNIYFFGYVVGHVKELGYFTLDDLKSVRGRFRLPIERDKWFSPKRLGEVKRIENDV